MPAGRPSKIEKWLIAFESVLNDGQNALICTDEELRMLTNDSLENVEDRVTDRTFESWKAGAIAEEDKPGFDEFLRLYKNALIKQRKNLFERMTQDDPQWQKWAWIIERKFDEWNIRMKTDNRNEDKVTGEFTIKWDNK